MLSIYTPENGQIEVSCKDLPAMIEISIKDSGIGIAPGDIEKLYNIDQHFKTQGTAGEKGTGLGLVLCKEFVEKHGGYIRVSSKIGEGSTFIFTLPKPNND